jgi:hypothetical protein
MRPLRCSIRPGFHGRSKWKCSAQCAWKFRNELDEVVQKLFHIKLHVIAPIADEQVGQISRVRPDAFRLARNTLLKSDAELYGQQFQGLYALMRGLAAAFWMGAAYSLGWSLYSVLTRWLNWVAVSGWTGLGIAAAIGFVPVFEHARFKG